MAIKNSVGRPTKMDIRTLVKSADALRNNYTVTMLVSGRKYQEDTYYCHMNDDMGFAAKMNYAVECRNKVSFNFRTI